MTKQLSDWAEYAYTLAVQAGEKVMEYYTQAAFLLEYKADNSPLTSADKAAHEIIYEGLKHYALDEQGPAPILSEEGTDIPFLERQTWKRYWCVDPLDGTREFLARNDEFSINIALIAHHQPIIGIIYVPTQKLGYLAWRGGGAYRCEGAARHRILTQTPHSKPLRLIVSRHCNLSMLQPWLAKLGETSVEHQGSASKFGILASGQVDLLLRLTPTSEWDNAAGHCVLEEAGGTILTLEGIPLEYNRSGSLLQGNFLAVGDKSYNWIQHLYLHGKSG